MHSLPRHGASPGQGMYRAQQIRMRGVLLNIVSKLEKKTNLNVFDNVQLMNATLLLCRGSRKKFVTIDCTLHRFREEKCVQIEYYV